MKKSIFFLSAIVFIILLAGGACSKKGSTPAPVPPVDTVPVVVPYKLVWSDEFDVPGLPNPANWSYDVGGGGWGNNELEYYTNGRSENARVENGNLVIETRKEPFSGSNYTSARLLSKGKGEFTYGIFEIRAKLPRGRGTWPAIWTLCATNPLHWPDDGELDIMEEVGYNPNWIKGSAHNKTYNGGNSKNGDLFVSSAQDSFHVYKMEWTSTQIDWYVDSVKYYSYPNYSQGTATWPYYRDFFIILNTAVGGNWGGLQGVDDSVFPQQMLIDYVRVYQRKK